MNRPQPPFPPLLAVLGLLLATWFSLTQTASAVFLPLDHSDLFAANSSPAEHQENSLLPPENRVWENFGNPNEITPADELNSLQLRWESHFGELENASGVLSYADGNPISLSDPFGLCADSGSGFMGYNSWSQYGNDAAESLGGVALGLTEGLSGGVIGIDNSTRNAMTELQRAGYHIGLTTSLIGAFVAPKATTAPKSQTYSGVYIPDVDTIMMRPSTYIDPPPSGYVPASGGHATVMAEMASGGVDVTNAQGFTAFSKGRSFEVEWMSRGVNGTNPNFQGSILPQELRPPVLNAIERSTGFPAVSTRKH